ncbi:hypothetical protein [Mucilaginibacter boryungensis]|uniref:Uncharacterized protein n=1 Tax=Mucilaginibacter boryungensis TaxID=768480 RepID=A0ABR9XGB8_9SPHI|nr:hypothetical protein [Mucilaginibacter boryungensis]MBE9666245.1 hypothetical protein [Mucilaginibacter boryungensis]
METNAANLYFKSKAISLTLLAATALVCTRMLFFLFNDPEGQNLLIVMVFALGIYAVSTAAYLLTPLSIKGIARLVAVVGIQVLAVVVLYFCMR